MVKYTLNGDMEAYSLLKIILETINDFIVYVDANGYIVMISKSYAEFLNVDREQVIGQYVKEVIPNTRLDVIIKTGKAEFAQIQKIKGKNTIVTRIPVFVNGELVGGIGKILFRDVDELNSLYMKINNIEKELNQYKNELKKVNKAKYTFNSIISKSNKMVRLKEFAKKAAQSSSNVLILGESGTGKDLFAHAIHNSSERKNGPFIKVNCGSIPHELLESELFGYEEGSFTGAKKGGKIGKFKVADGGTILDEIGDLPMSMQAKLLRVLQDKEIEKIGAYYPEQIDVRVIAATNKDLEAMIHEEKFRMDLYYRLNVIGIRIPPLRERKEDIPVLSEYLIKKISKKENVRVDGISNGALECLKNYDWPGNVRELENIFERTINFLDTETIIKQKDLPSKISGIIRKGEMKNLRHILSDVEKQTIVECLMLNNGNKTKTASILGISRTSLYDKLSKHGIYM